MMRRRYFLRALAALPASTRYAIAGPSPAAADASTVKEIAINEYDVALLPREHGQLTRSRMPVRRRYPSRDHCMQMAAFFSQKKGLIVHTKDSSAGVSDWEIYPGDRLRIRSYGAQSAIVTVEIEPTIEAAAAVYRQWALKQAWVLNRKRHNQHLNFISVASNPDTISQRKHLQKILRSVPSPVGAWFTQWRRFPFDEMYPDYVARDSEGFRHLLRELKSADCIGMPYINGMLWDDRLSDFSTKGGKVALRGPDGSLLSYNAELKHLRHACPASADWQHVVIAARESITDADAKQSNGIYLDMLLAAPPYFCWSDQHDHLPGDALSWQRGVRSLLENIGGVIMVEGCAECYIDKVDCLLMHLYTQNEDSVPLWSLVYGDMVPTVGWTVPAKASTETLAAVIRKAAQFGVSGAGSPWMTSIAEEVLLTPAVEDLIKMTAASATP